MNVFDYLFSGSKNLEKEFVLGSKEAISFSELYANSLKVASYFKESVGKEKAIVLIAPNSTFFITAYLAILKSGNICIPLNYGVEQATLEYVLGSTNCSLVVTTKALAKKLNQSLENCLVEEDVEQIIQEQKVINFDAFLDSNKVAEIIFTSGSTGLPKGVMLSHKNIITNTESILGYLKLTSKDVMCVVLPFFYCYGLSLLHTHLKVGGSIVLNNNFIFLGTVISDMQKYKCTGFAGVPSHFQILLKKSKTFKDTKFPYLKYVTQAGGKLHSNFIDEFTNAFPEINFYIMYGQTEATARLSYLAPENLPSKIKSIGKAIPNVELKIVDEKGMEVAVNKEGELIAKGDNIMLGYYKDNKATEETLVDGWLYTGDIAKKDEEDFIYLVDRKKAILKVGGKRVSPKEIEAVVLEVPGVIDCSIVGVIDEVQGEALQAIVVINKDDKEDAMKAQILEYCAKKLSLYKIPRNFVFKKAIAMNATGKKTKY
ncbi:class I adenylate-forming enzyme family protein [Maribacter sp.]|uniref:class I adenylate-forming enzyme family protein n=1 Tax=Maribacter sp. TaxID=1897614 RepID=UPI0025BFEA5F|nr:class I adenylate-forming enzyme family protein [Maribacter sp.]